MLKNYMINHPLIYSSIDTPDIEKALFFAKIAEETNQGLKLGLEFFNSNGPQGVAKIREACPDLSFFLDLKYHDIPNTVRAAVREASKLDIDYINVHASGGINMMKYAVEGAREGATAAGVRVPKVLGVTILTSLDEGDLDLIGYYGSADEMVQRLARLADESGLEGIVCSAMEIQMIRRNMRKDFVLMVPGIRPRGSDVGDQKRVMTPLQAVEAGATHLVIGRPITGADDPKQAILDILEECTS